MSGQANGGLEGAKSSTHHSNPMGTTRLSASAPVSMSRTACLRTRLHRAACRDCVDACPVNVLTVGSEGIEITGYRCTGCGRCQAACPMGAIAVDGFEDMTVDVDASRPDFVVVDCMRPGTSRNRAAEIRVPCLGGLSEGSLLALCARVPQRTVAIADNGQCASCNSGGATHPAAATLSVVVELMREAGVPDERLPRLQGHDATTPLRRGPPGDDPLQSSGRSRRGFFTALARPATHPAPARRAAALTVPSAERRSIVAALESLALRHGGRLPAALFDRVNVSSACRGHRGCASACPTGALVRWRDDVAGRMGIAFDSTTCIGCGHCAAVCPEHALELHHGSGAAQGGHRPLTRFLQCECADCGARFAATASDLQTCCERCRKSAQLAGAAFATLFSARP